MQNTLADFGVPSVLLEAESVFRARDARELHTILSAILRPANEALLRGALLTDALGLRFAELDALGRDGAAWERWIDLFRGWHAAWQGQGFIAMFQRFLAEGGVPARLLARSGGERRLTNLLHLSELLQKATLEERLGPRGLVKWLARQMAQPDTSSEEQQVRLERDDEAVRVVTIHKAKGLEYNIVFCPLLIRGARGLREIRFHAAGENALTRRPRLARCGGASRARRARGAGRRRAQNLRRPDARETALRLRLGPLQGRGSFGARLADASAARPARRHGGDAARAHRRAHSRAANRGARRAGRGGRRARSRCTPCRARRRRGIAPARRRRRASRRANSRGHIARDYCVSSFSSLTESHDAEVPDYDFPRPEVLAAESEAAPEGIHALPGGTRTGNCVHEIFEELEFTDAAALEPLVKAKLLAFAFPPEKWGRTVSDCVRHTLQAPLHDGFRLADLPAESRLAELEFFLPAGRLEAGPLRELLREDGMDRMDFSPRQGWLKGFIDLLAVHDGRYYIFDWKTNRLGDRGSAYAAPSLAAAMSAHRYSLQLHLYTLAVHRYLRQRVPGYDYETHFGGAYYLFLRGIDPRQPELGVHRCRPEAKTIAALETWLAGAEPILFDMPLEQLEIVFERPLLAPLEVTPLDEHFSRLIGRLGGGARVQEAARQVSAARGAGHTCLPLSELEGGASAWAGDLRASPVTGAPGGWNPLILDDAGRLYLQRYWRYEQELAAGIRSASRGSGGGAGRSAPERGDRALAARFR